MITCLHATFLALWQVCCTIPFVGLRARTPYAFILPASLFPYSATMAAISRALQLVLAPPSPRLSSCQCFPVLAQGGSASCKSSHATADQGPVKFSFSFLALTLSPLASSLSSTPAMPGSSALTALGTPICLCLLFSPFQGEHLSTGPPSLFSCNTKSP